MPQESLDEGAGSSGASRGLAFRPGTSRLPSHATQPQSCTTFEPLARAAPRWGPGHCQPPSCWGGSGWSLPVAPPLVHTPHPALGHAGCVGGFPFSHPGGAGQACSLHCPCHVPGPEGCRALQHVRGKTDQGCCWRVCSSTPFTYSSLCLHPSLGLPEAWVLSAAPTVLHSSSLAQPREPPRAQAPLPGRWPTLRLSRAQHSPWGGRVSPAAVWSLAQRVGSVIVGLRRAGAARSHSFLSGSVQSWYETNNFCNMFCFPSLHLKSK